MNNQNYYVRLNGEKNNKNIYMINSKYYDTGNKSFFYFNLNYSSVHSDHNKSKKKTNKGKLDQCI